MIFCEWNNAILRDANGEVTGAISMGLDITERKQAEEAIQKSEANYRSIFDTANDAIFVHDTESGKILSVNQKACEMFGYAQEELQELTVKDISTGVPPYDQEHALGWIKKAFEEGPQLFEWICKDKAGRSFWVEVNLKLAVIEGESRMLAIVRDITERRQADEALHLHESRLQALLELNKMREAPEQEILDLVREELIKITQSEFAFIGFMNEDESVMSMDNWSKETMAQCAVVDKPMHFPIAQAGLWGEVVRQSKPIVVNDYLRYSGKRGQPEGHVPIKRFLSVPVFDMKRIVAVAAVANKEKDYDESDVRAITSMMNDMWRLIRHKRAEEALVTEKNRAQQYLDIAGVIVVLLNTDQTISLMNKRGCEVLGYEESEIVGKNWFDTFVPEKERERTRKTFVELTAGETKPIEYYENPVVARNGQERIIAWHNTVLRDEAGKIIATLSSGEDITERREAEKALKHSEERYALAQRSANIGSWDWDITTGKLVWSEQIEPMFGFGRGEFDATYAAFLDRVHPDDRQHLVDSVNACVEEGGDYELEHRIIWPDGTVRWLLETGDVIRDEGGKAIRMLGIVQDVTDRKLAKEQIESLAKFPSEDPNPVLRVARDGTLLYANVASKPLLAEWSCHVGEAVPENWRRTISEVFTSGSYRRVEAEHAGRVFAFVVSPMPEAEYVNLYGRDITERKEIATRQELAGRILERLNQKSERLDLIHDVIKLIKGSTRFDAVGIRLREGEDFPYFEVNGFSDDFVKSENYLCARNERGEQVFDEKGHPVLACMCGSVIIGRADPALPFFTEGGSFWTNSTTDLLTTTPPEALQVPTRNRCNEAGYESVALFPLRCGDEIVGLLQLNDSRPGRFTPETISFFEEVGTSIGIALARVRAEEQVENIAKFPSENPYPVLRIAKDSTVLYANASGSEFLRSWGCKVGEQAPEHWHQYILRILKSGSSEELEVSSGDRVFSLIMAPVVDAGYVNAYGIDITARKLAEEDLRKYRQHLEELVETRTGELTEANRQLLQQIETRKQLEREILNVSEQERRRIGQELHDSLGQQLTGIAFMTKVLEQRLSKESAKEAAEVAEIGNLVNQATEQARGLSKGLHPIDLDAGTLASALQELATSTERLFGIECTLECGKRVEVANPEVAVHLYRITQEAITNAIKHGRTKNIRIRLAHGRDKSVLTVRNDGADFPKEFEARGTGMGLQIMDHRVDIIGGSLDIRKAPGGGTIMTCKFPSKKR
jgi:PAS domain S-box-containing protein